MQPACTPGATGGSPGPPGSVLRRFREGPRRLEKVGFPSNCIACLPHSTYPAAASSSHATSISSHTAIVSSHTAIVETKRWFYRQKQYLSYFLICFLYMFAVVNTFSRHDLLTNPWAPLRCFSGASWVHLEGLLEASCGHLRDNLALFGA